MVENIEQSKKEEFFLTASLDQTASLEIPFNKRFENFLKTSDNSRSTILRTLYYLESPIYVDDWEKKLVLLMTLYRHVISPETAFLSDMIWQSINKSIRDTFEII